MEPSPSPTPRTLEASPPARSRDSCFAGRSPRVPVARGCWSPPIRNMKFTPATWRGPWFTTRRSAPRNPWPGPGTTGPAVPPTWDSRRPIWSAFSGTSREGAIFGGRRTSRSGGASSTASGRESVAELDHRSGPLLEQLQLVRGEQERLAELLLGRHLGLERPEQEIEL